jgi:hypothetical protein
MTARTPIITGAVEGDADEAVFRRLIEYCGGAIGGIHGKKGKAFLLDRLTSYNHAAQFSPWVVLVDLDRDDDCAPPFRVRWLPKPAPHMCFRIVVRAVEAWLMADRERLSRFLGVRVSRLPRDPESESDPMRKLVQLAEQSRFGAIREDMVPRSRSGRAVGPAYTSRLIEFVVDAESGWRPEVAAHHSESLRRCVGRLQDLVRGR